MSVLKVTEVQAEEESKKDVVEAGQVRMTPEGTPVLIVDAKFSPANGTDEKPFIVVRLNYFDINRLTRCESAEEIEEDYPILLEAELTYKEEE